ncbi:DUF6639 family protein [Antarctobacter jejuensis]
MGLLTAFFAVGATAQVPCDNGLVSVDTAEPELAERACHASDRALEIFADCGQSLSEPVSIHTRQKIIGDCLGLFHCGKAMIEVLTPDALTKHLDPDGLFAHIPPDDMFESVVIHEMTHALYDGTSCGAEFTECYVTTEYLAYALQIEALTPELRAPWLQDFDPQQTVKRDVIGLGILMMKTDQFALSAWAHLNQRADRCAWIDGILDGSIVFDRPRP